jgi:hypothetical protein
MPNDGCEKGLAARGFFEGANKDPLTNDRKIATPRWLP